MKNLNKDEYLYGKCHLFALIYAKINNWKIECVYDTEAYDEDFNIISVNCLVHAYVIDDKGKKYDINGKIKNIDEYIRDRYECNSMYIEKYNIEDFTKRIKKEKWTPLNKNEVNEIVKLIVNYNLPLNPLESIDKKYLKIIEEIKLNITTENETLNIPKKHKI